MANIGVFTRGYDNARTGVNYKENILTAGAVQQHGVKQLFTLALPGDARGAEAQPLIATNIKTARGVVDLVIVCTMANQVFTFDANDGAIVWVRTLGRPIKNTKSIDTWQINDHWGVLSTPVIDPDTGTLY